jgi:dinuclear metal center YbgI/SA1388 family protein
MGTIIKDLTDFLEEIAPIPLQESYDNSGLILGKYETTVKGVICSLDATEEIIDEAILTGCNLVICHHPIVFRGLKKINGYHYVERTIIKAIKNDVAIYAIHTNLDNVLYRGVNEKIAQRLSLIGIEPLLAKTPGNNKRGDIIITGTGVIGQLPLEMSEFEFLSYLKKQMNTDLIRHTAYTGQKISKVAICGGSGSSFLPAALDQQAQVYVSADFKYHEFFEADDRILIADIGHFESEQFTIELLFDLISNNFSNFAAHYTKLNTNPVKYFK